MRAARALALSGAAALTTGASARAAEPDGVRAVEEVIVTGSRLPRPDLAADTPIATVGHEALEARGALTLDIVLNRLPQVTPSYSSAANNPSANGASYVDLRGLGPSRNLVLLDGRRIVGANASNSVDLNTLPRALVDRIEILTGGASAVYGPDAVAGVVNVFLKPRYDGAELEGRTLVSQRGDGRERELSLTAGHAFPRGELMASLGWSQRDEIGKGARPFSAQPETGTSWLPGGAYVTAGPNQPSQAAVNQVFAGYGVAPGAVSTRGGFAGFGFNADGTLFATGAAGNRAFDAQNYRGPLDQVAPALYPDIYAFNFQPFNKLILPLDRKTAFVHGELELGDHARVYAQALGARYTASTALAPSPAPTDPNPLYPGLGVVAFTIPVTNPFIPPDLATLLASRRGNSPALAGSGPTEDFQYKFRSVALGARQSTNQVDVYNLLAGAKADLSGGWRGEAYASLGRYGRVEAQDGLLSVRRAQALLNSPTGGKELCEGGFNPFGAPITEACRSYLRVPASFSTDVRQADVVATATGPLWRLPAGRMEAVVGAEYRQVRYRLTPPAGLTPGEVAGFLPQTGVAGAIRYADLFAEVSLPLLADLRFAERVEATLGWRRSHEPGHDASDSYKADLSWLVAGPVRLRGSFQHAVRSPDIFERFEPAGGGSAAGFDPCAASNPARSAQVQTLCRRQGAALGFSAADVDAIDQSDSGVTTLISGNPRLRPETARTLTAGIVLQPGWDSSWIGAVHASVDWYDIRIADAIGYLDPQLVLNACYNIGGATNPTLDPASPACAGVVRSSVDFSLSSVATPRANQALIDQAGVDAAVGFRTDLAALTGRRRAGRLETTLLVSWLQRYQQQASPLQPRYDFAGTLADAGVGYQSLPRWKGVVDLVWTSGPVQLDLAGRFIDSMRHRLELTDPSQGATGVGAAWYWDLSARARLGRQVEARAGVLNLLDRQPELYRPSVDAGTDPSTYDVIGRRFWLGLALRL
jgi:outer membrane receptor protein involved in Fe transport